MCHSSKFIGYKITFNVTGYPYEFSASTLHSHVMFPALSPFCLYFIKWYMRFAMRAFRFWFCQSQNPVWDFYYFSHANLLNLDILITVACQQIPLNAGMRQALSYLEKISPSTSERWRLGCCCWYGCRCGCSTGNCTNPCQARPMLWSTIFFATSHLPCDILKSSCMAFEAYNAALYWKRNWTFLYSTHSGHARFWMMSRKNTCTGISRCLAWVPLVHLISLLSCRTFLTSKGGEVKQVAVSLIPWNWLVGVKLLNMPTVVV